MDSSLLSPTVIHCQDISRSDRKKLDFGNPMAFPTSLLFKQFCHLHDLAIQKQPVMPCDKNPEQPNRSHSKDERRKNKTWREGEGEKEEEMEKDGKEKLAEEQEEEKKGEKMECEEEYPEKRLVSKPLMDTLWATFKLNKCPTKGLSLSLAFEFNMTEKQVNQWFLKKRKKFKQEMYKRKYKRKLKRKKRD
uniref:NANOG neighbor homeobox n=1 Tax=Pipistrellus kuhlii TaxID=59472 RepID=A0A7J7ZKA1_PIPKU|nr:NANOG neighbor homeobox [Pipistrellus kuhlii]